VNAIAGRRRIVLRAPVQITSKIIDNSISWFRLPKPFREKIESAAAHLAFIVALLAASGSSKFAPVPAEASGPAKLTSPDQWEPLDDSPLTTTNILLSHSPPQNHTLHTGTDEDGVRVVLLGRNELGILAPATYELQVETIGFPSGARMLVEVLLTTPTSPLAPVLPCASLHYRGKMQCAF
jgi:hypothetical protein